MADEPQYPADAPVGTPDPAATGAEAGPRDPAAGRNKMIAAGVAAGIGSAALVAALLYANRSRKGDKPNG